MDALGPTSVPHNPKHVSILNKSVSARVFQGILPLAHVAGGGHVTLINPGGVNLLAYELQLDQFMNKVEKEKSRLVWARLSQDGQDQISQQLSLADGGIPVIDAHQSVLKAVLEEEGVDWQEVEKELRLLDDEVSLAHSYQQQSMALRQETAIRSKHAKRHSSSSVFPHSNSISSISSVGAVPSLSISVKSSVSVNIYHATYSCIHLMDTLLHVHYYGVVCAGTSELTQERQCSGICEGSEGGGL